jgi:hypothetical protein
MRTQRNPYFDPSHLWTAAKPLIAGIFLVKSLKTIFYERNYTFDKPEQKA